MKPYERIEKILQNRGIQKKWLIERILEYAPISDRTNDPISDKAIYTYLSGARNIPFNVLDIIGKILDVETIWLINGSVTDFESESVIPRLPSKYRHRDNSRKSIDRTILHYYDGAIGAGSSGVIDDSMFEEIELPITILPDSIVKNPSNFVMFKIVGDSMNPTLKENDWVIIDMVNNRSFYEVDGIYLCNIDSSYQIKRLQFKGTKGIEIISDNKNYSNINSMQCDLFEIIGKLHTIINIGSGLALK